MSRFYETITNMIHYVKHDPRLMQNHKTLSRLKVRLAENISDIEFILNQKEFHLDVTRRNELNRELRVYKEAIGIYFPVVKESLITEKESSEDE